MRKINKSTSPTDFEKWKLNFRKINGIEPDFENDLCDDKNSWIKGQVKEAILKEQKYLCCYCCCSIEFKEAHIEHLMPKSNPLFSHLDLDYNNLLASCNGACNSENHCGHRKDDWYDSRLMVSPLDNDCESRFIYNVLGEIRPVLGDKAAMKTIKKLGLDDYLLNFRTLKDQANA